MSIITDVASSPSVAIPLGMGTVAANFVSLLPILINVVMFLYVVTLLGHKLWIWYQEYKGKQAIDDKDDIP